MESIRAKIVPNKELFRDDETGFKIYSADVKESDKEMELNNYGNISITGNNLPDFNIGGVYDLSLVKQAGKYRGSYTMVKSHYTKPQSVEEQWKFLAMVVTENQYENISKVYSQMNDKIIDIINADEFSYEKVHGYGKVTYDALKREISDNMSISEALAYFSEYDIPYNTIKRLVDKFGNAEKTIEAVEENPYRIVEKDGFGFIMADELAMKLGIDKDDPHRIKSCMIYVLEEVNSKGDVWITHKKMYNKMKKILGVHKTKIDKVIEDEHEEVFVYNERYSTSDIARDEMYLSSMIANKVSNEESLLSKVNYVPEKFIEGFEEKKSMELSDEQRSFFHEIRDTNVMFLIGNAGAGKSTIQEVVINIAEKLGMTYTLLSPTGKASRILKKHTGREAYTIHKRIGYGLPSEIRKELTVDEDIILVDEASMVDINIATDLMSRIRKGSLVVFIGDDSQIPSVGVGNFLFDCINSDKIPKVKLTKVFRQKESGMLDCITKTRQGKRFLNTKVVQPQRRGNNFEFRHMMKERIVGNLIDSYKKMIESGYETEDIAILVPTNVGEVGTIEINRAIQEKVNPNNGRILKDEHTIGSGKTERILRVGDFVMNTENMYDATVTNKAETIDIFNGETGEIIAINQSNKEIIVDFFGNHVLYSFSDATKKLNHAWAITTYKAQGSQYKVVLVVADTSATYQLNANLLYTAMSRAQDYLGVFGQAKAFNRALGKFANFDRNSFLGEFLEMSFDNLEDRDSENINLEEFAKNKLKELESKGHSA